MRLIGQMESSALANRFSDYLLTREIASHVEEGSDGSWQIWIEHDDDLDAGKSELGRFLANPGSSEYDARGQAARIRAAEKQANRRGKARLIDVRTQKASFDRIGTPVAIALMVMSCIVFILQMNPRTAVQVEQLLTFRRAPEVIEAELPDGSVVRVRPSPRDFATQGIPWSYYDDIRHGQVWRLVSPMLGHVNLIHLLFNMSWLWSFGQRLEQRRGSWFFLMLVLVGSAVSNVAQTEWYRLTSPQLFQSAMGMSGVNYALFGYLWINGVRRPGEQLGLSQYDWGMGIGWLFAAWVLLPQVANIAHVGGLLTGMAIASLPPRRRRTL